MNLQIHLIQRLLHVLEVDGGQLNQVVSMPPQRADGADFLVGAERTAQKTYGVQMLNPLAVFHVGLSARHVFQVLSVDQAGLDLPLFQDLKQRNPIHARRFHRHSADLALLQPVSQSLQVGREGSETANRLWVSICWHRNENFCGADINSGGIRFHHWQPRNFASFSFAHGNSLLASSPARRPEPCKKAVSQTRSSTSSIEAAMSSLY